MGDARAEDRRGVEEIVVRARRRAELLEDSPVAVTALGGEALRAAQASNLIDVASLVPNLTILSGRSNQDSSIVIRGVGAFPFIYFDQGVGTYVDGVYLSRQQGALLDIVDLEQVEVLRGPQGTLFGKNTVGGALNVRTVQPKDKFEGFMQVRTGSYSQVDTKATLNIPIDYGWFADKLATRITFASFFNEGYTRNLETGRRHSDRNSLNFLGSARLAVTDDLSLTVSGSWTREQSRGLGGQCVFVQDDGFPAAPFLSQDYPDFGDACRRSGRLRFRSEIDGFANSISYGTWGVLRWRLGAPGFFDGVDLRYTTSLREQETAVRDDAEMTEFPVFTIAQLGHGDDSGLPTDARQIQQELQISAEALDGMVSIVGGAFGYWEQAETNTRLNYLTGNAIVDEIGTTDNIVRVDNWDWALFGQVVVDPTEWLSLTGGVRFTQEKKALFRMIENAILDRDPLIPPTDSRDVFDGWTPSATLALIAPPGALESLSGLDHLMTYFTYARGFRGGGFNGGARTVSPEALTSFEPEFIDSYEVGLKTAVFDRRLSLSTAIFQMDRDNQQVPQIISSECPQEPCPTDVFTRNAAKTRSRGVELELAARSWAGWSINGSVGYTKAEFLDFPEAQDAITGASINRQGQRFPFLPEVQSSLGVQYTHELPGLGIHWLAGDLTSRVDWYYESEVTNWAPEITQLTQQGYNRINLRIAYRFNSERSLIALWSKNLTDERYFKNTLSWARLTGSVVRYYEPPRTVGVELSHRF